MTALGVLVKGFSSPVGLRFHEGGLRSCFPFLSGKQPNSQPGDVYRKLLESLDGFPGAPVKQIPQI